MEPSVGDGVGGLEVLRDAGNAEQSVDLAVSGGNGSGEGAARVLVADVQHVGGEPVTGRRFGGQAG